MVDGGKWNMGDGIWNMEYGKRGDGIWEVGNFSPDVQYIDSKINSSRNIIVM